MLRLNFNNKIILIVGSMGIMQIAFSSNIIIHRKFFSFNDEQYIQDILIYIKSHPKFQIYIVLNSIDQHYHHKIFPKFNQLQRKLLISNRTMQDAKESDIHFLHKIASNTQNHLEYISCCIHFNEHIHELLHHLALTRNVIRGIIPIPLLLEDLSNKIHSCISTQTTWKISIYSTKTSGLRYIVTRNGSFILTRVIAEKKTDALKVIAGNILQETENTLEYLKRLDVESNKNYHAVLICSPELKSAFVSINQNDKMCAITAHEASEYAKIDHSSLKNDRFSDSMIASFINKTPIKRIALHDQKLKKIHLLYNIKNLLIIIAILICSISLIEFGIFKFMRYKFQFNYLIIHNKYRNSYKQWNKIQKTAGNEIKLSQKIDNIISVYERLKNNKIHPSYEIKKALKFKEIFSSIDKLVWKIIHNPRNNGRKLEFIIFGKIPTVIQNQNLNSYRKNIKSTIKTEFHHYQIQLSSLPKNINLHNSDAYIPMNIIMNKYYE